MLQARKLHRLLATSCVHNVGNNFENLYALIQMSFTLTMGGSGILNLTE